MFKKHKNQADPMGISDGPSDIADAWADEPYQSGFSNKVVLGAFFIATDPVTAATSNKGKLYYGVGIGVLIYLIRTFGAYPDAIAFAVLLMNFSVPFIDYYTQPRSYGHKKARRGIKLEDKA